jgi:hypothetical protein
MHYAYIPRLQTCLQYCFGQGFFKVKSRKLEVIAKQ